MLVCCEIAIAMMAELAYGRETFSRVLCPSLILFFINFIALARNFRFCVNGFRFHDALHASYVDVGNSFA